MGEIDKDVSIYNKGVNRNKYNNIKTTVREIVHYIMESKKEKSEKMGVTSIETFIKRLYPEENQSHKREDVLKDCRDNFKSYETNKESLLNFINEKINDGVIDVSSDGFPDNWEVKICDALSLAFVCHVGVFRDNGEPYINHPVESLKELLESGLKSLNACVSMLLHDTVEDGDSKFIRNIIYDQFGMDVFYMVLRLTKTNIEFDNYEEKTLRSIKDFLTSVMKDLRVLYQRFADRCHNLKTIKAVNKQKRNRFLEETLSVFCPLARKFGLRWMESQMGTLSLIEMNRLDPDKRLLMLRSVISSELTPSPEIEEVLSNLLIGMFGDDIEFEIKERSAYKVLRALSHVKNETIYDQYEGLPNDKKEIFEVIKHIEPFKIVFHCNNDKEMNNVLKRLRPYFFGDPIDSANHGESNNFHNGILGKIHWKQLEYLIKTTDTLDRKWVQKLLDSDNILGNYRAYNPCIWIEISTYEMEEKNRGGVLAGHYGDAYPASPEFIDKTNQMLEKADDLEKLYVYLREDLLPENQIRVMGNDGKSIVLEKGSSLFDMAMAISSKLALSMDGAYVNGNYLSNKKHILETGDRVEIIISDSENLNLPEAIWDVDDMFVRESLISEIIKKFNNTKDMRKILRNRGEETLSVISNLLSFFTDTNIEIRNMFQEGAFKKYLSEMEKRHTNTENSLVGLVKEYFHKRMHYKGSYYEKLKILIAIGEVDLSEILDVVVFCSDAALSVDLKEVRSMLESVESVKTRIMMDKVISNGFYKPNENYFFDQLKAIDSSFKIQHMNYDQKGGYCDVECNLDKETIDKTLRGYIMFHNYITKHISKSVVFTLPKFGDLDSIPQQSKLPDIDPRNTPESERNR